jgi:hypothetical protein
MRPAQSARRARPCGQRAHGGAAGLGSSAENVWCERQHKHWGSQGRALDKGVAAGAYLSSTTEVRCGGGGLTVAFEAVGALLCSMAVG